MSMRFGKLSHERLLAKIEKIENILVKWKFWSSAASLQCDHTQSQTWKIYKKIKKFNDSKFQDFGFEV